MLSYDIRKEQKYCFGKPNMIILMKVSVLSSQNPESQGTRPMQVFKILS